MAAWPTVSGTGGGQGTRSGSRSDELLLQGLVRRSGFSPPACPASPPPAPEGSEEALMTAGSGRRLCACFDCSTPLGRFSRILLELATWASPEFSLKWKLKTTKCGSTVFQLAPSARRTDASGIGSWPTVVRQDDGKTPEAHLRMKREMPGGPRATITSLQVMCKATWPTPAASNTKGHNGNRERPVADDDLPTRLMRTAWPTPAARDVKSETCSPEFEAARNLESRGKPLTWAVKSAWPTPRAEDSESTGAHRGCPDTLTSAARTAWATPKRAQGGPDHAIANRPGSGGTSLPTQASGPATSGCLARTESFAVRLTTLSAWLMGYTARYLAAWETASSRRSRKS